MTGGAAVVAGGRRDWREEAVCRWVDPELFFPVGDSGPALAQVAEAKGVCARCPVVAECLSFAVVALPWGVAGGLTAQERRELGGQRGGAPGPRPASAVPAGRVPGVGGLVVPAGVDGLVVASLVAGNRAAGASRQELAAAAVALARAGRGCGWIAARLGLHDQQVRRWVARHRAGKPLNPASGRPRRGRVPA